MNNTISKTEIKACLNCGKVNGISYHGCCDVKCHGSYWGKKSLDIDYGYGECPKCKDKFKKKSKNQIYCTTSCRDNKSNREKEQTCQKCGKKFWDIRSKKYCNPNCRKKNNATHYHLKCQRCSKEFVTTHKGTRYCSDSCLFINKSCLGCGNKFRTRDSDKRYCSLRCSNEHAKKTHAAFTLELFKAHGGYIVPLEEYRGSDYKIRCKCIKCGNEMNKVARTYIGTRSQGCKHCGTKSHGEDIIAGWLDDKGIQYVRQYSTDDLKYVNRLLYDFAIMKDNELEMLIEYDGLQHFKPVKVWGGEDKLQETIVKDEMKNNYANEIGVPLLRITYKDKNNIEEILNEKLG